MKSHLLLSFVLALGILVTSCGKEEDTIALVRVTDVNGLPIEDVLVRLYPEPSGEDAVAELVEEVEQFTDAAGEAIFDFTDQYEQGQAGFAVLNIEATKDTLTTEGIIKIDPEMVNEETIVLQ